MTQHNRSTRERWAAAHDRLRVLAEADALLRLACSEIPRAALACLRGKGDAEAQVAAALGAVQGARGVLLRLADAAQEELRGGGSS